MSDRWNHRTVVVDKVAAPKFFVPGDRVEETEHPAGFKVRVRGAGGTVVHAYRCPVHGLFDARVERASVPDEVACPIIESGWYHCDECSDAGSLCTRCDEPSPWAGSFCGQGIAAGEVAC